MARNRRRNGQASRGLQDEERFFDRAEAARAPEALVEQARSRPNHGLDSVSRTEGTGGGLMRQRIADLPWEEHRRLYDLQDESSWLAGEWRRRTRGDR